MKNPKKVQNIIIDAGSLIIINSNGGQHIVPITDEMSETHRAWISEIKSCALSLMSDYDEYEFADFQHTADWDITVADGLDDMDIFDFELPVEE